jgi:hypothetical protein
MSSRGSHQGPLDGRASRGSGGADPLVVRFACAPQLDAGRSRRHGPRERRAQSHRSVHLPPNPRRARTALRGCPNSPSIAPKPSSPMIANAPRAIELTPTNRAHSFNRASHSVIASPSSQSPRAAQGLSRLPLSARRAKPEHAHWGRPTRAIEPQNESREVRVKTRGFAREERAQLPWAGGGPGVGWSPSAPRRSRPLASPPERAEGEARARDLGETAGAQAKPSTCEWGHPCCCCFFFSPSLLRLFSLPPYIRTTITEHPA